VIRVLVADGSERIRANLLRRLAAEEDITVCGTAEDGEQALQEALHLVPDIAILDAGLTGLDGVQATEMLAEYAPQAGVILMSMERAVPPRDARRSTGSAPEALHRG
jgi:DNA-binding NarL/FixJ family response regulator